QKKEIPKVQKDIFAMDTYMSITGYGDRAEEAVDASLKEIQRLDKMLSVGNPSSEISLINNAGTGSVSEDTAVMIAKALEVGDRTNGRFDITIYPLMVEWGFTSDNFHVPEKDRLDQLLTRVDYKEVQLDRENNTVTIGEEQGIDLGGIAKGFTSDRIMEIFREYGLTSGMVTLGGNVECLGTKTDGSLWRCGIKDPYNTEAMLGVVSIQDRAVITSGAYERNFTDEKTGKLYHHIIDPLTGYSAEEGLISVTIVSESGMLADALSTSMYILGLDGAIDYWKTYGSDFDMILMTDTDQVYITEGIKDCFTSDYETIVVEK
ncbi:MAG: FAD:protein FMN transferase, partial [Lachnospiraceae bacterium]|nr:FAD:protein FMN transferase [Lachnospiraceae bacterium]